MYYGDNLDVLRPHVKDESEELVYLDPPSYYYLVISCSAARIWLRPEDASFNRTPHACAAVTGETSDSHACGLQLNEERDGTRAAAEIKAFADT